MELKQTKIFIFHSNKFRLNRTFMELKPRSGGACSYGSVS